MHWAEHAKRPARTARRLGCLALGLVLFGALPAVSAGGEGAAPLPFVQPLFSDCMVLQRGVEIPVWGWAAPGSTIAIRVAGATATAVAGADGRWCARIQALAAGGPHVMTIEGPQSVTLTNVAVGDLWLCSGQSNMDWPLAAAANAEAEIAASADPDLRLFTVPKHVALEPQFALATNSAWRVCAPGTARGFSAVGFFFGRHLRRELGVPVGLISAAWGGTIAEAWTSREGLSGLPDFAEPLAQIERLAADPLRTSAGVSKAMLDWYRKNDAGSSRVPGWEAPDHDATDWKTMRIPQPWEKAVMPVAGPDIADMLATADDGDSRPGADADLANFDGLVWFWRSVELPTSAAGQDHVLRLGPVADADTTWFNGVEIGTTDGRTVARQYAVPGSAVRAGRNVIAVRVLNAAGPGGLCGQADQLTLAPSGTASTAVIRLAGDWQYRIAAPLARMAPRPQRLDLSGPNVPTVLYNGMIAPLVPLALKGAIWYQGESNATRAQQYRSLLPALIRDWRSRFGGDFPFCIVQLANFMARRPEPAESQWAELREAQRLTALTVTNAGLAVAIDIGEAGDIHPRNKQDVGRRLALAALAVGYGRPGEHSGPTIETVEPEAGALRLSFGHAEGGLVAKGETPSEPGRGQLQGFAVAGEDGRFVWAEAAIEGNSVRVSSPAVARPTAVRYGWADNPPATLYNTSGLPASPFGSSISGGDNKP